MSEIKIRYVSQDYDNSTESNISEDQEGSFSEDQESIFELSDDDWDETELDLDSLDNYLSVVQKNPLDGDMIVSLIEMLEEYQYFRLACQVAKIGLELNANHYELIECLQKLPPEENPTLLNLLKNAWFTQQCYQSNEMIKIKPLNQENLALDLDGIIHQSDRIPTFADMVALIPSNQEFFIFRKFHLEKYQMYILKCRCVSSPNLETFLHVTTEDNVVRLNHKLSRSVIQYKFNSLDRKMLIIGLKGNNKQKIGQIRLMEMTLEKINLELNATSIRSLASSFPIVGTIVVNPEQEDVLLDMVQSVTSYFDKINVYLNNWKGPIPDYLQDSRIKIVKGNQGLIGLANWCPVFVGYHFFLSPNYIYHKDYVPLMISKIQQYQHRLVVGLKGIQIHGKQSESRKVIPTTCSINQDIKCHLLGLETVAYFTGGFYLKNSDLTEEDMVEVQFALLGQEQQVPFICVERLSSLVSLNPKRSEQMDQKMSNQKMSNQKIDQLIQSSQWKFF